MAEDFNKQVIPALESMFKYFLIGMLGAAEIVEIKRGEEVIFMGHEYFVPVAQYPPEIQSKKGEIGYWDETKKRYVIESEQ